MSLRQTGSVQEYASRLRGLVVTLGWSDSVTVPIFREGLKLTIKWELRKENTKKLSKIIKEAQIVNNALADIKQTTNRYIYYGRT